MVMPVFPGGLCYCGHSDAVTRMKGSTAPGGFLPLAGWVAEPAEFARCATFETTLQGSLRSMAEHLELPRPLLLLRTTVWSLTESFGLPVAAYAVAAWLNGRNAGLLAGLAAIWATAVVRKLATGSVPGLLTISAIVLTLQAAVVISTGALWLFLLQFPVANLAMCVMFARTAGGQNPLVARLAAEVVALRQPSTHHPGLHRFFQGATWLWAGIFLLLTASLAVLMVTESTNVFLLLSTVATVALVVAGTGASTLWFLAVLRRLGLSLRFAPA